MERRQNNTYFGCLDSRTATPRAAILNEIHRQPKVVFGIEYANKTESDHQKGSMR